MADGMPDVELTDADMPDGYKTLQAITDHLGSLPGLMAYSWRLDETTGEGIAEWSLYVPTDQVPQGLLDQFPK